MKYTKALLDDMEAYSVSIGLEPRLINFARTKEQADTLYSIQSTLLKYDRHAYRTLHEHNKTINDPDRDLKSTKNKLDDITSYIEKYHDGLLFLTELKQLQNLKKKLDELSHHKTDDFTSLVMENVVNELNNAGFSKNTIIKGIGKSPSLKSTFKSILTE